MSSSRWHLGGEDCVAVQHMDVPGQIGMPAGGMRATFFGRMLLLRYIALVLGRWTSEVYIGWLPAN
jgi:hypothetical protein